MATLIASAAASAARREAGLTPQQLHAAYELPATTASSSSQTIALVELGSDPTLEADLAIYDRRYGLPSCTATNGCLRVVNAKGEAAPLPASSFRSGETSIDVEEAHAICENCRVLVVEGDPASQSWIEQVGLAVNTAVHEGATEVTVCIELYEAYNETEETALLLAATEKYFTHPGVVITVASGDCGYDESNDPERWEFCESTRSHYPSFPAKAPTVIDVGGTTLMHRGGVWQSSAWAQGGAGCSAIFAAPQWQSSIANWSAVGCGTQRLTVDVAADADPHSGPRIYDSTAAPDWHPAGWGVAGGTSVAAPIVAAEFALAGGSRGIAYPAQTLYSHAGDGTALEDIAEGGDGSCGAASVCRAGPGFDGPTGLGTPVGLSAFSLVGAPTLAGFPTIAGTPLTGHTLTASRGSWEQSPTTSEYQWEICDKEGLDCLPIDGETGATYVVRAGDVRHTLRVMETAGNAFGYGPPAFSESTAPVRPTSERRRPGARGRRAS